MALWLQPGEEPETAEERADLDAILALRESAAIELKVYSFDLIHSKKSFRYFREAIKILILLSKVCSSIRVLQY
jgi:hypothetical protein